MVQREVVAEPMCSRRLHWANQVARHAHEKPMATALRFRGTSTSWAELQERSQRLADGLYRRGLRPGDRLALLMTNRPSYVGLLVAACRLGLIAVPLNFRLSAREVSQLLVDSEAAGLVCDETTADVATQARADAGSESVLLFDGDGVAVPGKRAEHLADLLAEHGESHPPIDVPENSPAFIIYTAGTTGLPKGAVLTHLNLHTQAITLMQAWRMIGSGDVNLCALPMFHIAGLGGFAPVMLLGATTVIHPSKGFDAGEILDCLERERVTILGLVPAQWRVLCAEPGVRSRDLVLRVIAWGTAPATDALLQLMAETFPGAENVATFGQTEMSPITCVLDGRDAIRKLGSVGKPTSMVQARVVDENMHDVGVDEVGEIVYRGPCLMEGYWRNSEATAEVFAGGWFHSGDLVRRDGDGFIYVVDRKKDMLISGGENIYCAEVENALSAHPRIAEVALIGRQDEQWGEVPVAVVVARDTGEAPSLEELREWCGSRLARYKHPRDVVVVAEMPRNVGGKVLKSELRYRFAN